MEPQDNLIGIFIWIIGFSINIILNPDLILDTDYLLPVSKVSNLKINEINPPSEYLPYPLEYLPTIKTVEMMFVILKMHYFLMTILILVLDIYPYLYNENVRLIDEEDTLNIREILTLIINFTTISWWWTW